MHAFGVAVDPERVAVYIRWSTEEQGEGTTLQVQRESCEHYLQAQGWKVREDLVFIDDGYSGGSMERPALGALRKAIRDGKVTCVVVFKLDRLSRCVIDTVNLVLQEWEGLCYVKSTREPVDTTTAAGKMFFYMLASYAEWERSVIRERTLSGKIKRAQQGKNPGFVAPYGYARGERPGEWVVNEAEAAVVRRIFGEYAGGKGLHAVAAGLHRSGARPRRAARWHPTTLAQMLDNPAYMGVLEYGCTTVAPPNVRAATGAGRVKFDEPRYARVEGALPVIIPAELFEQIQRVRESRGAVRGRRALAPEFLLSGIARCSCGGLLRGDTRADRGRRYYRCARAVPSHPEPCRMGLIPAPDLETAVVAEVRRAFEADSRHEYVARWEADVAAGVREAEEALGGARGGLGALAGRRRRLDADYDVGELPARLYAERVEQLADEEARLRQAEQEALRRLDELGQSTFDVAEFGAIAARVDAWEHLSPEERKQVMRHAVAACVATRAPSSGLAVAVTIWRPKPD